MGQFAISFFLCLLFLYFLSLIVFDWNYDHRENAHIFYYRKYIPIDIAIDSLYYLDPLGSIVRDIFFILINGYRENRLWYMFMNFLFDDRS